MGKSALWLLRDSLHHSEGSLFSSLVYVARFAFVILSIFRVQKLLVETLTGVYDSCATRKQKFFLINDANAKKWKIINWRKHSNITPIVQSISFFIFSKDWRETPRILTKIIIYFINYYISICRKIYILKY